MLLPGVAVATLDYIQHNPWAPNGREFFKSDPWFTSLLPGFKYEFSQIVAYGDFVYVHFRSSSPMLPTTQIGIDMYRVSEDGILVEHWDMLHDEVPQAETASGNAMFPIF